MAKKKAKLKEIDESRMLQCKLMPDEQIESGKKLAQLIDSYRTVENEMKSNAALYKAKLKGIESQIEMRTIEVNDGVVERSVPVKIYFDFPVGEAYTIRQDTKEEIERRPITDEERQGNLADLEDKKAD